MRIAIVGSRNLSVTDFLRYLPDDVDEIISGGARGVDAAVREFAMQQRIPLREFLTDYQRYGRAAPLKRNELIVSHSDLVLAFWDGKSKGTQHVIRCCRERGVACRVHLQQGREFVLQSEPTEKQTPPC